MVYLYAYDELLVHLYSIIQLDSHRPSIYSYVHTLLSRKIHKNSYPTCGQLFSSMNEICYKTCILLSQLLNRWLQTIGSISQTDILTLLTYTLVAQQLPYVIVFLQQAMLNQSSHSSYALYGFIIFTCRIDIVATQLLRQLTNVIKAIS